MDQGKESGVSDYTPGPWRVEYFGPDPQWYQRWRVYAGDTRVAESPIEANANLIAAAPDMYETLTSLWDFLSRFVPAAIQPDSVLGESVRNAIAKAEGR